jgi:hypothetical protein
LNRVKPKGVDGEVNLVKHIFLNDLVIAVFVPSVPR